MSVSVGPQEYPDIVHPELDIAPPVAFEPYIPAATILRELTPIPGVMGTILGAIFGASSPGKTGRIGNEVRSVD